MIIDGTTQPGYAGSPIVELNGGFFSSTSIAGLWITAGHSTVKGLVINRFTYGIILETGNFNTIQGNFIGTDVTGTAALGNAFGISVYGSGFNLIGGNSPEMRNLISGNTTVNLLVQDQSTRDSGGTVIKGNYIGTDVSGNAELTNPTQQRHDIGISLFNTYGIRIGGNQPGERNIISGNASYGIAIGRGYSGVSEPVGYYILGNYIGTNASGTAQLANSHGIAIWTETRVSQVYIGGSQNGEGNVISGNTNYGILIAYRVSNLVVQGNFIGTDASGNNAIPNAFGIVFFDNSSPSSVAYIGGILGGEGNIIANNAYSGIYLGSNRFNSQSFFNIRGNSIYSNGFLGIDIVHPGGPNQNDPGDADTGTNQRQNFPILDFASGGGGTTNVRGVLNSRPSAGFTLDFYSSPACDPSGYGQGQTYLGSANVSTDSSNIASFNVNLAVGTPLGHFVTATATDTLNNTSEFSPCRVVAQNPVSISGRALDGSGAPLPYAQVRLTGGQTATTTTNSQGNYSFADLRPVSITRSA